MKGKPVQINKDIVLFGQGANASPSEVKEGLEIAREGLDVAKKALIPVLVLGIVKWSVIGFGLWLLGKYLKVI